MTISEIPAEVYEAAWHAYLTGDSYGTYEAIQRAAEVAYAAGRASARAEVAADLRATFVAGAQAPAWTLRNGMVVASSIAEWAARIAEGQP